MRVPLSQLGLPGGSRAAGQSWLGIVTDELLFLFFVLFSFVLSLGLLVFSFPTSLPLPCLIPFPSPPCVSSNLLLLGLSLFVVSQLEVLHYRLNVSSALHSPAQPSLQALHAYQVLAFSSLPLPQGGRSVCWYSARVRGPRSPEQMKPMC